MMTPAPLRDDHDEPADLPAPRVVSPARARGDRAWGLLLAMTDDDLRARGLVPAVVRASSVSAKSVMKMRDRLALLRSQGTTPATDWRDYASCWPPAPAAYSIPGVTLGEPARTTLGLPPRAHRKAHVGEAGDDAREGDPHIGPEAAERALKAAKGADAKARKAAADAAAAERRRRVQAAGEARWATFQAAQAERRREDQARREAERAKMPRERRTLSTTATLARPL